MNEYANDQLYTAGYADAMAGAEPDSEHTVYLCGFFSITHEIDSDFASLTTLGETT